MLRDFFLIAQPSPPSKGGDLRPKAVVTELRIDVAHHLEHQESLQLFGLGVERQVAHIVAVYAAESERKSYILHCNFDVLRSQHFEIGGTNDCSSSRRERRHPAPAAASTTATTAAPASTASRDSDSAGSPQRFDFFL